MNRRQFLQHLSVAGAAAGLGAGNATAQAPQSSALPNVVFLVADTMRSANLPAWGYPVQTTPHLDRFLEGATRYQQAYAPAPWTLPSHVSFFTGQYSFQHRVHQYLRKAADGTVRCVAPPLAAKVHTLVEVFKEAGYATGAFSANTIYLEPCYGLNQGFDTYTAFRRPGLEIIEKAWQWVEKQQEPFFLFLNLMDAHKPYNIKPTPENLLGDIPQDQTILDRFRAETMPGNKPLNTALAALLTRQYDAGIANADYAFGVLMKRFKAAGLYDPAMVIFTSDHGEFLGEHLLTEHAKDPYDPVLFCPLAIKNPHQDQGRVYEKRVSLVQLPASILKTLDLPALPLAAPPLEAAPADFPILAENCYSASCNYLNPVWGHRFRRCRTAFYQDDWKLIRSSDGAHELYHLADDPAESKNHFAAESAVAQQMLASLKMLKPQDEPTTAPKILIDPADIEGVDYAELEALGYL